MKRTFELLDGKSAKFWEIDLDGNAHTVRYGKIGTTGQSKTKSFKDAEAASKDAEKLIKSKTKKGYAEIEANAAPAPDVDPAALDAQLTKLDADPSDEGRVVFGDWLQSVGHPWGQLIGFDHAGKSAERDAVLAANPGMLGELARRSEQTAFAWRVGFIDEATIRSGGNAKVLQQCMQALFALPLARYLRRLVLDGDPVRFTTYRDWDNSRDNMVKPFAPSVVKELAGAPATLTELAFGATPPTGASAYVSVPDLAAVAKQRPGLEVLEVQCSGDETIAGFGLEGLRRLEMRFASASAADLEAVRQADLPALESLSIWLGGDVHCILDDVYSPDEPDYDEDEDEDDYRLPYPDSYPASDLEAMSVYSARSSIRADAIEALCNDDWPESLVHFGLQSAALDADMLEAIATSKLVTQLKTLDLSGGTLDDKGASDLAKHAKHLRHLERIDLRRNNLGKKGASVLEKMLGNVDCSEQRTSEKAPEFLFRYVATME